MGKRLKGPITVEIEMITKLISRQRGIALMMVLSTIALLTVIMVSFSFDNKLNVINSNNMQNRAQAKLPRPTK